MVAYALDDTGLILLKDGIPCLRFTDSQTAQSELQNYIDYATLLDSLNVIAQNCLDYQAYLDKTDHKFNTNYKPSPNEDLVSIGLLRDQYREYLRANKTNIAGVLL